jgi:membrane protease YdiL (CAAX protease family)
MKRFAFPQEENTNIGHYLLVLVIVLLTLIFFGSIPIQMAYYFSNPSENETYIDVFDKWELFLYSMLPFGIFIISLWLGVKYVLKRPFLTLITARKSFDFSRYFFGLSSWFILLAIMLVVAYGESSSEIFWNYDASKFWIILVLSLVLTPIQTGFEELVFRGLLIQLFGKVFSRGITIVLLSSLLFMAMHLGNPEISAAGWFAISFYFFSGVFTSVIVMMDDGLELPWGFHSANNFFGILILTNDWQVIQSDALFLDKSDPSLGWDMIVTLGVYYPLMLFVFSKVYKWNDWKGKLFKSENQMKEVE